MASNTKSRRSAAETLELVLVYGQKKLPLLVSTHGSARQGPVPTVGHLSDAVTDLLEIPAPSQKLIHRGRTLFTSDPQTMESSFDTPLSSLGIKNGEKIMLLGKKASECNNEPAQNNSKDRSPLNSSVPVDPLSELQTRLESVSGRLHTQTQAATATQDLPGLKQTRLALKGLHEETMKLLEACDSLSVPAENAADFRSRRKALVNALQAKLDICESQLSGINGRIKTLEAS